MSASRLVCFAALGCVACGGGDVDLAILMTTPAALCGPEVEVRVDENGVLYWDARGIQPPLFGSAYTLWLIDQSFAIESCVKIGTLPVSGDGVGHGTYASGTSTASPVRLALSRPDQIQLVVTLEADPTATRPDPGAFHVELWTPQFPRAGDTIGTRFAFGDASRERRLEDFISASGVLTSPTRGFGRVEISYPTDRITVRFWNLRSPLPGRVFVLWASDGSIYDPLATIRFIPDLPPTRPSEVNGFEPTGSELRIEVAHDPRQFPWDRFVNLLMTYESEAPNDEHITPRGVVVMRGEVLAHAGLLDYPSAGGHDAHGGGGEAECVLSSAAHGH